MIVGNKIDREGREVTRETAEEYAAQIKADYQECSALTGDGVDEVFKALGLAKMRGLGGQSNEQP